MQVQIHYQGLESSPWMAQFITKRVTKLSRYLNQSSSIMVNLKHENRNYITTLAIHNLSHDYAFTAQGENLYESFAEAVEKASRVLTEHKRMIKDKINRRYSPLKHQAIA